MTDALAFLAGLFIGGMIVADWLGFKLANRGDPFWQGWVTVRSWGLWKREDAMSNDGLLLKDGHSEWYIYQDQGEHPLLPGTGFWLWSRTDQKMHWVTMCQSPAGDWYVEPHFPIWPGCRARAEVL